jgi:hypothetical protein
VKWEVCSSHEGRLTILLSSWMWWSAIWYIWANVGAYLPNYTASHPRERQSPKWGLYSANKSQNTIRLTVFSADTRDYIHQNTESTFGDEAGSPTDGRTTCSLYIHLCTLQEDRGDNTVRRSISCILHQILLVWKSGEEYGKHSMGHVWKI